MILIEALASTELFVVTPEQEFFPHGVETALFYTGINGLQQQVSSRI
jgi:hypothetical protein